MIYIYVRYRSNIGPVYSRLQPDMTSFTFYNYQQLCLVIPLWHHRTTLAQFNCSSIEITRTYGPGGQLGVLDVVLGVVGMPSN